MSLPSIHPSIQKSRSNKTINSMSSIIRYCMCSIGVQEFVCWCWFPLGFLQNPKTYMTGELETVSECAYEYMCLSSLWWIGHLSRVLSCLWPRKGSSLPMTLHRKSYLQNVWNRWMYSTVRVLVLPLCHSISLQQCALLHPCFQTKSF